MMKTVESTELSFLCGLVKDKWALQGLMHGQSSPMCPTHTGRQTDILGMSVLCGIKICGPHKHQICGGSVRKYGTELLETNYHISFHSCPDGAILLATRWSR